jgi:nitric oxide reductase NorD protein
MIDPSDLERLTLLASAIAGRSVDVSRVGPDEPAWTDGTTIFIDPVIGRRERLHSLVVQASLLGAGSLDGEVLDHLARRPSAVPRYLAVEGHRALSALEFLLPATVRSLIDAELAGRSDSPARSLALATSRERIDEPPRAFGTIRPRRVRWVRERTTEEPLMKEHRPRAPGEDVLRELDDNEEDILGTDLISSPIGGGGAIGRLLKRLLGDARSSGSGPPGADAPTHWARPGWRRAHSMAMSTAVAPVHSGVPVYQRGTTYPEWDVHRRRYRPDWCTVTEVEPLSETALPFPLLDTHAFRRPLARLGMTMERRDRQLQGIDIDIDAAVQARVEAIAGAAPEEAVYVDLVRRRRDLAVLLLLDVSGSAGEPSAMGGTVHEHQRAAAAALTMALHDLGDRVALYAFRSQGRAAVHVVPVKRFGDTFDAAVLQRLERCAPGAYTRLGAAIRHGAAVLEREAGMSRRLLVVLSDGFAYDHGYEGAYGEADARRALAEARRRGTGCLCLSLGAATDAAALGRVFGTAAHASLPRVDQLPRIVGPLFRFALRSAEAQRRVSQRMVRTKERLEMERHTA